jgi:hypothetical protein
LTDVISVGASTGLNITDLQNAQAQASKVASSFNATATGINLAVQNLGNGLAGQIAPALGSSGALSGSIGPAVFALASGIGNATAKALNLTNQAFGPSNGSGIEVIAGNLGLGVTTPIVSNIDFQAIMNSAGGSGIADALKKQLPQIAAAAGNGLGEGVKNGLGLQQSSQTPRSLDRRQDPADPLQGIDLPATVNQFTKGLSQSLLTGVDVKNIASSLNLTGNIGDLGSTVDIRALAGGAGSGIGLGLAIGFGFKGTTEATLPSPSGGDDTALAAETFTQNLVSNFLLNSTIVQSTGSALTDNAPQILKDVNIAQAAEGFARGAIEGVASALSSIGGFQNLIDGNFSDNALENVPTLPPTGFNDTLNGSAVSFARGFTGEGTILIGNVLKQMSGKANKTQPSTRRALDVAAGEAAVDKRERRSHKAIIVRQAQDNTKSSSPLAISESTLSGAGQFGIDTLTCQGVGGLASVFLGVTSDTKDKTSLLSSPLDSQAVNSLPQGPVEIRSKGNTYRIVLRDAEITINGLLIKPFAALTALHGMLDSCLSVPIC